MGRANRHRRTIAALSTAQQTRKKPRTGNRLSVRGFPHIANNPTRTTTRSTRIDDDGNTATALTPPTRTTRATRSAATHYASSSAQHTPSSHAADNAQLHKHPAGHTLHKSARRGFTTHSTTRMAAGQGFEPWAPQRTLRFSTPPASAARAPRQHHDNSTRPRHAQTPWRGRRGAGRSQPARAKPLVTQHNQKRTVTRQSLLQTSTGKTITATARPHVTVSNIVTVAQQHVTHH